MKNFVKRIPAICFSLLATSVFAQGTFDGINVQGGVGFSSLNANSFWDGYGTYKTGQTDTLGSIAVGYSRALDNRFNLNANVFFDFGASSAGALQSYQQWKLRNVWGIALEPGYYLTDNTLGYLKLGYAMASSKYSDGTSFNTNYGSSNGVMYGAGLKRSVSDHLYVGAEAYQIQFDASSGYDSNGDISNNRPSMTYGGVLVGYNFMGNHHQANEEPYSNTAFDGVNLQLGAGIASLDSNASYSGVDSTYKMADKNAMGVASLGYSHGLGEHFNLAANVFHNFGSSAAGSIDYLPTYSSHLDHWKLKDIWGVTIEPGYYLGGKTLSYMKLGYVNALPSYSASYLSSPTQNGRADGVLYGAGFKQMLTGHIYVGAEAYQAQFKTKEWPANGTDSAASNKPSMAYGGVVAGYKF